MLGKTKIIVSILTSAVLVAAISFGVVIMLNGFSKSSTSVQKPVKSEVDEIKNQAIQAKDNNDLTKAKTLFEQAKDNYELLGETNSVVDMEAQIYLLEHPSN
jgi:outer membrane protein assembly factor BamD (BamD/ComL family)